MKIIALLVVLLVCSVGISSATITGITPNSTSTTNLTIDTVWESETLTTENLIVKNLTSEVNFSVYNSTITIDGNWILGSDTYNIGSNTIIENSAIIFNVSGVVGANDGQVVDSDWFEGATWGTIDRSRYILIDTTISASKVSSFIINDSIVKGYNATTRAHGIIIRGTGDGNGNTAKPHKIVATNTNFSYLGGTYAGGAYYALHLQYYDAPPSSYGSVISNDSELSNLMFYYCGRGIGMPNYWDSAKLIDSSSYEGGITINSGKYFNNLHLNLSTEPLGQASDGVVFNNSWINANGSKLNFDSTNSSTYNNTITRASINLGDGSASNASNVFYDNILTNAKMGSRKGKITVSNNTIEYLASSGYSNACDVWGHDHIWNGNNFTINTTGNIITVFNIMPHVQSLVAPWVIDGDKLGNNQIYDNIISGARYSFYINNQHNLTLRNNSISGMLTGYTNQFLINDSVDVDIIDMDLYNPSASSYDISVSNSENVKLINVNQTDDRTNLLSSKIGIYYYLDIFVKNSTGNPISGAIVTFTNEINESSYPCLNGNGNIKNTFTTGVNGHVLLPIGNRTDSPVLIDYSRNSATNESMTWQIGSDAVGYNTNNSAITGLNLTSAYYRSNPNSIGVTHTIILSEWSHDVNSTYNGQTCTYYTNGSRTCTTPLESDKIIFINQIYPVVT